MCSGVAWLPPSLCPFLSFCFSLRGLNPPWTPSLCNLHIVFLNLHIVLTFSFGVSCCSLSDSLEVCHPECSVVSSSDLIAFLFAPEPFTLLSTFILLGTRPEAIAFCGSCKAHSFTVVPVAVKSSTHTWHALPHHGPQMWPWGKFWGLVSMSGLSKWLPSHLLHVKNPTPFSSRSIHLQQLKAHLW